ncbi:KDO2-lipid IV(A) lauroyltransferase [Bradyrhizobium sp. USDA 4529]
MKRLLLRTRAHLRDAAKPVTDAAIGGLTIGLLRTTRYFDPEKTARFFGRAAHFIGRRLREDRIGRENLKAAFPEKSPEEIEEILTGVWHNLGRIGAEFAHIDRIWDHDPQNPDKPGRVEFSARSKQLFDQLRDDGKPALFFAAHLGNWELSPIAAAAHGLDATILFRRPNIEAADRAIERIRAVNLGTLVPAGRDAPLKLAQALKNGQHVAMLVDQYLTNGVPVTFFGRKTTANRESAAGAPAPADRLPNPRHADHPPARRPLPRRGHRGSQAGVRRIRPDRYTGHHAGDHRRRRGLGP